MSTTKECSKELKINKAIYSWSIPSFCFDCKKVGEKLSSSVFPIANTKWLLELYPRGVSERFGQYMSLYLRLESGQHIATKFQLSIIDCDKKNCAVFEDVHEYHKDISFICGKSDFIKQTELKRHKDLLLPNDMLTICCEISIEFTDKQKRSEDNNKKRKRSRWESESEPADNHANSNMYEMYFDNKQYSDVIFVATDGRCINAHKVFLINKSEVFANLFSMDMPVLSPDIINVKDVDYEVLYEVFRFIYTGKVNDIKKYAVKLLNPADRFKLGGLKILCEKYLCNNLSVANAVELFFLAEDHDFDDLKDEIKYFIALNMNDFVDLPEFKELTKRYPKTVVEIVQLSIE